MQESEQAAGNVRTEEMITGVEDEGEIRTEERKDIKLCMACRFQMYSLNCRYLQLKCTYLQFNCRYLQINCRYLQFN